MDQRQRVATSQQRVISKAPLDNRSVAKHTCSICGTPVAAPGLGSGYAAAFRREGITMTRMPAAAAASTPLGASSMAKQSLGSTPRLWAAARKQSGAGLPLVTWHRDGASVSAKDTGTER